MFQCDEIGRQFDILRDRFSASAQMEATPFFPSTNILGVSGVLCDTVTHIGNVCERLLLEPAPDPLVFLQWAHLVMQSTSVHNVECNECVKIIYGVRHKCRTCPDFDLCNRCFRKAAMIHPAHT